MYGYDFNSLIWFTLSASSIQTQININNSNFIFFSESLANYKNAVVTYERQ